MSIADDCHKWPRGFKTTLIDLDGDKCFFCHNQQKPFHIAHVNDWDEDVAHAFPYLPENRYNPLYCVLLCASCHAKVDSTWRHNSPFYVAFITAFRRRFDRLSNGPQATLESRFKLVTE